MPGPTLPIDKKNFPTLKTRRALLVIDCQNDFTAEMGPLRAVHPDGYIDNIIELAHAFRPGGDVIWVRTEYGNRQIHQEDEIIASNTPDRPGRARGRARIADLIDAEAFLGTEEPKEMLCARKGTKGAEFAQDIENAIEDRDRVFTKSHYSAFKSGELLAVLRMRFVTEIYLCGSLLNIGIFATAVDAARHGYEITLVEDCCGYRSSFRYSKARKKVEELTGCDIVNVGAAIKAVNPDAATKREKRPNELQADGDSDGGNRKAADTTIAVEANTELKGKTPAASHPKAESSKTSKPPIGSAKGSNTKSQDTSLCLSLSQLNLEGEKGQTRPTIAGKGDKAVQPQTPSKSPIVKRDGIMGDKASFAVSKGTRDKCQDVTSIEVALQKLSLPTSDHKTTTTTTSASNSTPAKATPPQSLPPPPNTMAETDLCEGDTNIIHDVLSAAIEDGIFEKLKTEVDWVKMSHQGGEVPRLVGVQGEVGEDGSQPIYRHPSDESPLLNRFTPSVRAIKEVVEKHLNHPLNHVLIQWYRDGHDYISEHSDKTLDIVPDSFIANVSLGAQRTMVLRTKRQSKKDSAPDEKKITGDSSHPPEGARRQAVRVALPHNSLFKMGLQTNMRWLHGIRQDKRTDREKTKPELAYSGARISLTFRRIGTYMDKTGKMIWGQGATGKTRDQSHEVVNGQTPEAIQMLKGFGTENHASVFDWKHHYGGGFDVLHMYAAARLFTSPDITVNNRVQLMLAELGISYARGSISSSNDKGLADNATLLPTGTPIMFVDNDDTRTVVEDEMAIMTYLDQVYGDKLRTEKRTNSQLAQQVHRFHHGFHLCRWWREVCSKDENKNTRLGKLRKALAKFDAYLESEGDNAFISGTDIAIADFSFFPTLHEIVDDALGGGVGILATFPKLKAYHSRVRQRDSVVAVIGEIKVDEKEKDKDKHQHRHVEKAGKMEHTREHTRTEEKVAQDEGRN